VRDFVLLLFFSITEIAVEQTLSTSESYVWNMYVPMTTHSSHAVANYFTRVYSFRWFGIV